MQYRILGRTGLKVSVLGFGTGGPRKFGQDSGVPFEQQRALVQRCFDRGINLFDTAQGYGDSELLLARTLEGVPRHQYVLSSKWSHTEWKSPTGSGEEDGPIWEDPEKVAEGVETSLQRLATDYLDIFHLHGVLPEHCAVVAERFGPVIERLKEQGKIRFLSLSERYIIDPKHDGCIAGMKRNPELWDIIMIKYGILNQWAAREALPLAQRTGAGVMNMAAVRIKLPDPVKLEALIADWKQRQLIDHDSVPDKDPLGWLLHDGVTSVTDAAYKFGADHSAVGTLLTGTANIEHLEQNIAAMQQPQLPEDDKQKLIQLFSHIAEYA
jgi:L-galactose dehydrogenase